MNLQPENIANTPANRGFTDPAVLAMMAHFQQQLAEQKALLAQHQSVIQSYQNVIQAHELSIRQRDTRIEILEELLRLKRIQQFAASSEKHFQQIQLFDEVELEADIAALCAELPDELVADIEPKPARSRRQRGFSASLVRERIELTLSESEKAGATKVFFTKVKEELQYIPAQLKVLEYWQEKAVFPQDEQDLIIAAKRPAHPLGKCTASLSLLAYIITSKYADGLPLYRLEHMFGRLGHEISRSIMANWVIQSAEVFKPLINLMREVQNSSDYLQADESRMPVLKEDGKTAQSDKWMWVIRGGPPTQPSVLFEYDPSRSGSVPVGLLYGFTGILQVDGYPGYGKVCRDNGITRIGCWDHARRKFMEALKAIDPKLGKSQGTPPAKAFVALGYINKLYAIERKIKLLSVEERYRIRQELSVPQLAEFKTWLTANVSKIPKESLTGRAISYTLNQWSYLVGYCMRGDLNISNVLAENAIRPFAIGRKAWLFADTSHGARASATCYSLIETAKANGLEPAAYIEFILSHIAEADTLEKLERLLPWNRVKELAASSQQG